MTSNAKMKRTSLLLTKVKEMLVTVDLTPNSTTSSNLYKMHQASSQMKALKRV